MLDKQARLTCHGCEPSDVLKKHVRKLCGLQKTRHSCTLIYGIKQQTPYSESRDKPLPVFLFINADHLQPNPERSSV